MRSKLLLPHRFKLIGIILFVPFLILGILHRYADFRIEALNYYIDDGDPFTPYQNLTDEVTLTGLIISLLMIAFARQRHEDEFIHHVRLESWQWAVLINFLLLIISTWVFYDEAFIDVMMYNLLTPLLIFIIRFNWALASNKTREEKI